MTRAVTNGSWDGVFFRFDKAAMEPCPNDSIDYALMEKTKKAVVVEADIGWSDIGSWRALWELAGKDDRGNVITGDVILEDVENSLIRSGDTLVAAIGLRDTLVVETADAVLVAPIARAQDVKKIVERLKTLGRNEFRFTERSTGPGAATRTWKWGSVSRSRELPSIRAPGCPCRCIIIATNTGWW
jgi:hypothetical protein